MSTDTVTGLQAPVQVRTDVPGRPFTWIDPTPYRADENGHVWTFNESEPCTGAHCLLCCDDHSPKAAARRCGEAELIIVINECRAAWIAEHRVEEGPR
ncbi:hypothetical protein ACIQRE_27580 [Streptomyces griseoluteus]|uniref:hypothetical protein n=1 Tax=Streptomyces griseoluteus TaxID=29306 RepID=UPI0038119545